MLLRIFFGRAVDLAYEEQTPLARANRANVRPRARHKLDAGPSTCLYSTGFE